MTEYYGVVIFLFILFVALGLGAIDMAGVTQGPRRDKIELWTIRREKARTSDNRVGYFYCIYFKNRGGFVWREYPNGYSRYSGAQYYMYKTKEEAISAVKEDPFLFCSPIKNARYTEGQ